MLWVWKFIRGHLGSQGSKAHFHQKRCNSYRLHGMVMWFMHMHQLDTLYQSNGCENSSGVIWSHRGQNVIFTKNAVTRSLYIARPYDSNMYISLRPSTYVMGSEVNLWSFGVTGVKPWFSLKNALSPLCYVLYQCNSCICIRLTPLQNLLAQISIWDHRGQNFFFTKNAVTSSIRLT